MPQQQAEEAVIQVVAGAACAAGAEVPEAVAGAGSSEDLRPAGGWRCAPRVVDCERSQLGQVRPYAAAEFV